MQFRTKQLTGGRLTGCLDYTRALLAKAATAYVREKGVTEPGMRGLTDAEAYYGRRWGTIEGMARLRSKAAVGALEAASDLREVGVEDAEFFSAVLERSILSRLGLRPTPFNVRLLATTDSAVGYWVGESKAIPVSLPEFAGSSLPRRKVAAIMATTQEAVRAADPLAEARFEQDLLNCLAGALDLAFLDAANAGIADAKPAAVTYGAPSSASTGNPATDLAALIAAFEGDLSQAVLATDAVTAAEIALARDAGGAFMFPGIGARGGEVLGIPVHVSRRSPRSAGGGQLALIDGSGIAANVEGVEIEVSANATLQMDDAPTGASDTPAAGPVVSMFQTDSVAFKSIIHANWEAQRPAVSVITAASYAVTP